MTAEITVVSNPVDVAVTDNVINVGIAPTQVEVTLSQVGPQGPPGPAGGYTWSEITGATQAQVDNAYVTNNASRVVVTLPPVADQFSTIRIVGKGAGGWMLAQNAGQTVHFSGESTTTGTAGSLASQEIFDSIEIVCITQNTDFSVMNCIGNITLI